jgi:hypothetical protein
MHQRRVTAPAYNGCLTILIAEAHVADTSGHDSLATKREFVGVLRVVVGPPARVLYGEIVDPDAGDRTPFVGSDGLPGAVETWVTAASERRSNRPSGPNGTSTGRS